MSFFFTNHKVFEVNKHPNLQLIEKFFDAFANANMEGIQSILAPNIRWIIPGHHPLAGTKVGVREVLAYFEQLSKAGFKAEPKFMEANDSYVVDFHRVYSTKGPLKLDGNSLLVWRFEEGKIVEVQNFPGDQHEWDRFFWQMYTLKSLPDRLAAL